MFRERGYSRFVKRPRLQLSIVLSIMIFSLVVAYVSLKKQLRVDIYSSSTKNDTFRRYGLLSSTQASTSTVSENCQPYNASDSRSFSEREPPQLNLPRRISNLSRDNLLQTLRSLRLVVVACAYNVEKEVAKFRIHVEKIVDLFDESSRILIFESDSSDDSLATLRRWSRAKIFTGHKLKPTIPDRSERIAYCRNVLLDKAREFNPDYLLTLDLDMFAGGVATFLSNFDYDMNDWSAMTGNVQGSYYDIWALRTLSDSNLNFDVWHRVWALIRDPFKYCGQAVTDQVIGIHQKPIPIDRDLLEVRSAFSSAGLYKMNSTNNCYYSGANTTCEHVPFHLCMREKNQARIFINPRFCINVSEN